MSYDSTADTRKHIDKVRSNIELVRALLAHRGTVHDASKLQSPEKEAFDEVTPLLRGTTYGSEEYKANLRRIKPAIDHHQKNNSHHPEFYENGIDGMSLLDLIEMFCDWKAATERHADGDIKRSIAINKDRFAMSPQLASILENTRRELHW